MSILSEFSHKLVMLKPFPYNIFARTFRFTSVFITFY